MEEESTSQYERTFDASETVKPAEKGEEEGEEEEEKEEETLIESLGRNEENQQVVGTHWRVTFKLDSFNIREMILDFAPSISRQREVTLKKISSRDYYLNLFRSEQKISVILKLN